MLDMRGTPPRPDPSKPGLHIPVKVRIKPDVPFNMPEMRPARQEEAPRKLYVRKEDFKKMGYTENCDGCARLSAGMEPRRHTDKCRKRMNEEDRGWEKKNRRNRHEGS